MLLQPILLQTEPNAFAQTWEFFQNGGIFMYLLAATSFVSFTVIIWRAIALRRERVIPKKVERSVTEFMPDEEHLYHLLELLPKHDTPFSRLVMQACRQFNWTKSENQVALQTQARKEIHHLERGLTVLEIIIGIAPLLGLLGTVSGLVRVFANLGFAESDPTALAVGISEALNTTIAGLAVAIPSLIAHNIFIKRVEWLAVDMETAIEGLLAKCYHEDIPAEEKLEKSRASSHSSPRETEPEKEPATIVTEDKAEAQEDDDPEKELAPAGADAGSSPGSSSSTPASSASSSSTSGRSSRKSRKSRS